MSVEKIINHQEPQIIPSPQRRRCYSLYLKNDQPIFQEQLPPLGFNDIAFPCPNRLERLDYEVVGNPLIGFIKGIHGNENPPNLHKLIHEVGDNYLLIDDANPLASTINERGYIRPPTKQDNNQTTTVINKCPGIEDDLNRQFRCKSEILDEIRESLTDNQARLLFELALKYPSVKYWFDFHTDNQFGHFDNGYGGKNPELGDIDGFHIYDSPKDARYDKDYPLIQKLICSLRTSLVLQNFSVANGVVDDDPIVALEAKDGYIYQPMIREDGIIPEDTTFDGMLLWLSKIEAIKAERVFTIEIPGGLKPKRQKQLFTLVKNKFILPFLDKKIG